MKGPVRSFCPKRERGTAPGVRGLSSGSILSDSANELSHNLSLEKCPETYRVSWVGKTPIPMNLLAVPCPLLTILFILSR